MKRFLCWTTILTLFAGAAISASGQTIVSTDGGAFQPGEFTDKDGHKVKAGTAEEVEGKAGKAVKLSFVQGSSGGFMTARIHGDPAWDKCDGFSFWVKGDGSGSWAGIELIDRDDFGLRYGYCFAIDSTEWRKVTVPWRDLTPELAGPPVDPKATDPKAGYAPSRFGNFWFGKWFYWRDYPAHSFTVEHIALEPKIDPAPAAPDVPAGLTRVRQKLEQHKPVTIVTMGDSLSDEHHWSNKQTVWSRLLVKALHDKFGSDVTRVNPAIGGTTLSQNIVQIPRWVKEAPSPDLVIVWFGGNDWGAGVRGPIFAQYLHLAVERIRRETHGSADILLLSTCPSYDRWDTMAELEKAVRDTAAEQKTGLVDIAAEFRKPGSAEQSLKQEYWAWDKTHLGGKGHEVVEDAVLRAIAG